MTRWRCLGCSAALVCVSAPALAQTWIAPRTTPSVAELVAVDETGEPLWPYGNEDVAGDGDTFDAAERAIDLRTAYAATDDARFYFRAYVASQSAPGDTVTVYVFIDADENAQTGGSADDADVDPDLPADPSPGGYEYVIGIAGNGTVADVWSWDGNMYQVENVMPAEADAESGNDDDPIFILSSERGYVQAAIDLGVVGLTATCDAILFVRSVDSASGAGDGDVGEAGACEPTDADGDGVPDFAMVDQCSNDDECPGVAVCIDGQCVTATPCVDSADCEADEECSPLGACIAVGGGTCMTDDDCDGLVCEDGTCVPCDVGGDQCGPGQTCGPDGRCTIGSGTGGTGGLGAGGAGGGLGLEPGDAVQGGACSCSVPKNASWSAGLAGLVAAFAFGLRRRGRRP